MKEVGKIYVSFISNIVTKVIEYCKEILNFIFKTGSVTFCVIVDTTAHRRRRKLKRKHWVVEHNSLEHVVEEIKDNDGCGHVTGENICEFFLNLLRGKW